MAGEILHEACAALLRAWPLLLVLTAVGLSLLGLERVAVNRAKVTHALLLALGIAGGLWLSWQILWIADDAFISFRYARNFARGLGLVYNEGEWVEGYTNFLWTLGLGLAAKLGLDIPLTALFGNFACFVAALVVTAWVVLRLSPGRPVVPFAALGLALAKPFYTFSASGLETMAIALLGIAAFALSLRRRGELWAGVALTASVMCRPDQILLYAALGVALIAEDLVFGEGRLGRRLRLERHLRFAAPFALIFLPYFFIRWAAYGAPLPNTFYTKSGSSAYWRQGFVYLTHFLTTTGAWLWFPLFLISTFSPAASREAFRLRTYTIASLALLGTYVIRVGGDFMEFRFFVPLLPLIAASTEVGLRQRAVGWQLAATTALALGLAWTPVRIIKPFEIRWHLAAEETFYQVESLVPLRIRNGHFDAGVSLYEALTKKGIRPMIAGGAIGMVGYYSDLPLFDVMGLTSRTVGTKEIRARSRPGHEKRATLEEMLEAGVLIDLAPVYGPVWEKQTFAQVGERKFHLARYEPDLVSKLLSVPGAKVPDPERDIRALLRASIRSELLEARRFYATFLEFWPGRGELLGLLDTRLASVADFEDSLPEGVEEGDPFRILRRRLPQGTSGEGYLSSLWQEGRGELRIPFRVEGKRLAFALGGPATERLGVELLVGGEVRARAHPSGAPGLRPFAFDTAEIAGQEAVLRIFDEDPRAEVGLEVDAIHFAPDLRAQLVDGHPLGPILWEAESVLPADDPIFPLLEERVAERFRFDDGFPEGTVVEGEAFGNAPSPGAAAGQLPLRGQRGPGLLNSFMQGDAGQGRILLPERKLEGAPIHLLVGGGLDCRRVYVGLEVRGRVVARACGMGDEVLRPARLSTARHKGAVGRVVVVDDSSEPWGHILVDEVIFEKAR